MNQTTRSHFIAGGPNAALAVSFRIMQNKSKPGKRLARGLAVARAASCPLSTRNSRRSTTAFPAFRRYASARSLRNFTLLWSCSNSTFAGLQGSTCCLPRTSTSMRFSAWTLTARARAEQMSHAFIHLLGSFRFELRITSQVSAPNDERSADDRKDFDRKLFS